MSTVKHQLMAKFHHVQQQHTDNGLQSFDDMSAYNRNEMCTKNARLKEIVARLTQKINCFTAVVTTLVIN